MAVRKDMYNDKIIIKDDVGQEQKAAAPVIVSASRATDIPAFRYAKLKDKDQRKACGSIQIKDTSQYDTCTHGCVYCYANTNQANALSNYQKSNTSWEMLL